MTSDWRFPYQPCDLGYFARGKEVKLLHMVTLSILIACFSWLGLIYLIRVYDVNLV
jgi:hypothetical protein